MEKMLNDFKVKLSSGEIGFVDMLCKLLHNPLIRQQLKKVIDSYDQYDEIWLKLNLSEMFNEEEE